jgi:microcystin-dependent protein
MDPYLASIWLFGGNFNPRGFALCAGQILPISPNAALFSLLGTNFGGNGTSNFGLPDLRGRTPIGQGQGPGLSQYDLGEFTGTENTTLLSSNIASHNHSINAVNTYAAATASANPAGNILAEGPKSGSGPLAPAEKFYNNTGSNPLTNVSLNPQAIGVNVGGAGLPVSIQQPYLTVTAIICTSGVYPARN